MKSAAAGIMRSTAGDGQEASLHVPVMLTEVMELLSPRPGETIVDGTVGAGGHSVEILKALAGAGTLIGIDRDAEMAQEARGRLERKLEDAPAVETKDEASPPPPALTVHVVNANYSEMDDVLKRLGDGTADGILLDLGVASPQIDRGERGFSYRVDGPLDMRMDAGAGETAEEWLNRVPESELADVIYKYGQERFSRRIARAIVQARQRARIRRTSELAEIIMRAVPRAPRRLHPARRSFQAMRIYINREMEHLERFLQVLPSMLRPNGRCVVISYHSLEDGRVKTAFRNGVRAGDYAAVTRKPWRPTEAEIEANPRSRSARVRAVVKIADAAPDDESSGHIIARDGKSDRRYGKKGRRFSDGTNASDPIVVSFGREENRSSRPPVSLSCAGRALLPPSLPKAAI